MLESIFADDSVIIDDVIDHFDIDLWYEQKAPEKYSRVFPTPASRSADFWIDGYLRLFVSHLSSNKERVSDLKGYLERWGISAFIAHEDIEPSREWMKEVEAGLETMDALVAIVEPGFKESDWCAQEVGYALARKVDIIPLRAGLDPFGFFGKLQGIQIKGKFPKNVSTEIARLLFKKPKYRKILLRSMSTALTSAMTMEKIEKIGSLDSLSVATDDQIKNLLEGISLSEDEKTKLKVIIERVDAFKPPEQPKAGPTSDDKLPF
ncbi:MAG: toll/interleukin-1 receptor domain-containing protein [Candidatus Omnitrophica bacterium]|nr:toll/interleukin-1 receptor domain-containing protein [Candidatus Omnitrophota bacterium]